MRIPSCAGKQRLVFQMTPMIDVVFLLIVFFLVSSHLASQEVAPDVALPTAQSGVSGEGRQPRAPVLVNVLRDGTLLLGSLAIDADELLPRLRVEQQQVSGSFEIRIRADRNAMYRHVEPILNAAAAAGVQRVTFMVSEALERRD